MAKPDEIVGSIARQKDVAALASKRQELVAGRSKDKTQWALNREFYKGNQWVFPNPLTGAIESLQTGSEDLTPRFKVRLTSNQILPGVQAYVAQLTKTKPVIYATPDSGDDKDLKSAQMANALNEHLWRELHLKAKLQSALTNATLSQGYWKITWDPLAGKPMRFLVGPDGKPVTDPTMSELYRESITEQGGDPAQYETVIHVGEICVEVLPGENVLLDPAAHSWETVQYVVCTHAMDPDEIKARWGVEVSPDSTPGDEEIGLPFGIEQKQSKDRDTKSTKQVHFLYVRKGPASPDGRYVAWIEGGESQKILEDEAWPFPFEELPIVKFPGLERPNSALDEPIVTHQRPLQKELNRTLSQIVQHKNLTIKPQMTAAAGSLRQRLTEEPGAVFEFNPIAGLEPKWREMPALPPYVFEHLRDIQQRIDNGFNLRAISRGDVPPNVEAGVAIDLLQEAAVDQVAPVIQRMETALALAGDMMAALAQKFYIEPRLLKIKGAGGSTQVKKFMNSDISGGFSFHSEAGSGLPRTRAGRQARVEFLLQNQLIDPKQALKMLDVADLNGVLTSMEADEDQALREHEKIMKGEVLNPLALQQAHQQIQQMLQDPNTDLNGDGIPDPPEAVMAQAEQMLHDAAIQPLPFEDSASHLATHSLWMKSTEFERLPPEQQQTAIDHYQATMQAVSQAALQQAAMDPKLAPKSTFQFKATTSAPVAAKVLERQGIQTTADEVAQPPLETWVTDSIDKPDADSAGNNPLEPLQAAQAMDHAQEQHDMKQAETAHKMALAERAQAQAAKASRS